MMHDHVELAGGGVMVFEDLRTREFRCAIAGCTGFALYACDQRLLHDVRCNRPLCAAHATRIGTEDLCPQHMRFRGPAPAQETLGFDLPAPGLA